MTDTMTRIGKYNVRLVRQGDQYGLHDRLTHDKPDPLIEFYDTTHMHTERGQFVSRYYVSTLTDDKQALCDRGLCLQGGVPSWSVEPATMDEVFAFIEATI